MEGALVILGVLYLFLQFLWRIHQGLGVVTHQAFTFRKHLVNDLEAVVMIFDDRTHVVALGGGHAVGSRVFPGHHESFLLLLLRDGRHGHTGCEVRRLRHDAVGRAVFEAVDPAAFPSLMVLIDAQFL